MPHQAACTAWYNLGKGETRALSSFPTLGIGAFFVGKVLAMAIRKSELNQRVGTAAVEQCDGIVAVRFRDGVLTPDLAESTVPTYQLLSRLLLSWDVLDVDGQPLVPLPHLPDDERIAAWEVILRTLPLSFLYEVEQHMFAAVRSGQAHQPTAQPNTALTA